MPCNCTPNENPIPPTHEDFRWIHGPGREEKFASFIELTRDISAGITSCMQIIYARAFANSARGAVLIRLS
jgi:hypothetical protein